MTGGFRWVSVGDPAEYARLAGEVHAEPGSILPILESSREALAARVEPLLHAGRDLPVEPHPDRWVGEVVSLDAETEPMARVLARATGRPLRALDSGGWKDLVRSSRSHPVTLVGLVGSVRPAELATVPGDAQLGLMLARSVEGAADLVARTVLLGPSVAPATGDALEDLSYDALGEQATGPSHLGLEVSPTMLRERIGDGVGILAGRGHGRDCLAHLSGGGICGRSSTAGGPVDLSLGSGWSEHPTACQQGQTCWRDDVLPADHLLASDVAAAIVVLDSCRTAVAAGGAIGAEVSLPLSMIEGTAIAAAAAVGTRGGVPHTGQLFTALVRGGHSLGAALIEMNGAIEAVAEGVGRLILFGDAGLVPAPHVTPAVAQALGPDGSITIDAGRGAVLVGAADLLPEDPSGPLVLRRRDRASAWVLSGAVGRDGGVVRAAPAELDTSWTGRVRPWLDRVTHLPWQGVAIDRPTFDDLRRTAIAAVRGRASAPDTATAENAASGLAGVVDRLAEHQRTVVEERVAEVANTFFGAVDAWPEPHRVCSETELLDCPQCGERLVVNHRIAPAGGAGVELSYRVCARCGEVFAGDPGLTGIAVHAPAESRLGSKFDVTVSVSNDGLEPRRVAIGAAALHEQRFGCRLSAWDDLTVGPGESEIRTFSGTSDPAVTLPDLQAVKVIVMAEGSLACLTRSIWMRR